jgi:hypothetical protein
VFLIPSVQAALCVAARQQEYEFSPLVRWWMVQLSSFLGQQPNLMSVLTKSPLTAVLVVGLSSIPHKQAVKREMNSQRLFIFQQIPRDNVGV